MRRRPLLTIAALSALVLATGCDKLMPAKPASYNAVDITGAAYGKALSLTDAEGRTRTLADFGGKYVVVFFGFTQCPDVCPGTLAELAQVKKALGPDGDKVQGVFITVDPDRDTAEVLKGYVTAFDPSFVALRGTPEQVATVAKDFKVFYQKVPGKEPGSYTMDHTAGSYVFDTKGNVRLFTRYGTGADALTSDLKQLMKAG
jgi:protein SCO1/2